MSTNNGGAMERFILDVLRYAASFMLRVVAYQALWLWFAVPLGLPILGWPHIFGLVLLAHALAGTRPDFMDGASDEDKRIREWATAVIQPMAMLLFGFVYKSFM